MSVEAANEPAAAPTGNAPNDQKKPIHSICLDTGPLIKNDPPVSTLLAQADELYTMPSIIDEIRDRDTRMRVETTLMPFVKLRNPRPESVKFITEFARKTGDLEVMSRPDIHLLALTYELELEKNGGDWRLRTNPNQKSINGKPPGQEQTAEAEKSEEVPRVEEQQQSGDATAEQEEDQDGWTTVGDKMGKLNVKDAPEPAPAVTEAEAAAPETEPSAEAEAEVEAPVEADAEDSDDGWITPSNLKKHQAKDTKESHPTTEATSLKVALLTSDFAMQNVALRMGLNLLSPAMSRITQLKNWVLRCHGCFQVCKTLDKQFCPRCGQPTLTRVSCTTNEDGTFQIHLKRNFQYNTRGNVYSIPKPVAGTASGKLTKTAGGKNNWGTKLILAEDQREYEKAQTEKTRERKKDLMDEDYLPNIFTGERTSTSGKIRLGPGRSVNSRKARG